MKWETGHDTTALAKSTMQHFFQIHLNVREIQKELLEEENPVSQKGALKESFYLLNGKEIS